MAAPGLPDLLEQPHRRFDQRRQHAHDDDLAIRAGRACAGAQRVRLDHGAGAVERLLAALARQLAASDKKQRGHASLPGQSERAVQQQRVSGGDAGAFQPDAGHFNMLAKLAALKRLLRHRQAKRRHVPADQLGAGGQIHRQAVFGLAAAVADRFQWQPFEPSARFQRQPRGLQRPFAGRAVKARRARRGDQAVRACPGGERQIQRVAANQPTGRMDDDVVADARPFRVQALQNPQRPAVAEMADGFVGVAGVVEFESRVPGHGPSLSWQANQHWPPDAAATPYAVAKRPRR